MITKDYVLVKDVNYFGRVIKRGSTFKQYEGDKDWFRLFEIDNGILMECPGIKLHFTSFNNDYFVRLYS